tara:strand:+ start:1575 stop:2579 length:1005 start_codon:yes stop_codon:yes gene_type:complete
MKIGNQISIIIPCYNEGKYISDCINSIINSRIENYTLEIIVVDGSSTDNTLQIINDLKSRHNFIRVLNNPKKVIPVAMNIGIKAAKYEIIMKMDAHSEYDKDYIDKCFKSLIKNDVDNVGGNVIHVPRENTPIGRSICAVLSSPFGVGNSFFRIGSDKERFVDTVPFGCFKKSMLLKINCYDEKIFRSEDIFLNHKIKKNGGKILLLPDVKIFYKTRSKFFEFLKHNFDNGLWSVLPIFLSREFPFSMRHQIPLLFSSYILSLFVLSLFYDIKTLSLPLYLYFLLNLIFSFKESINNSSPMQIILLPLMYFSLHFSYGIGSIVGLFMSFLKLKH